MGNGGWEEYYYYYYYWHGGEQGDGYVSNMTMMIERGGAQIRGEKIDKTQTPTSTETTITDAADTETQPTTRKLRIATGGRNNCSGTGNSKSVDVTNRSYINVACYVGQGKHDAERCT